MQIDFFRYTRPFIKVKCETAVRRQHLEDCVLQRRWAKLWLVRDKNSVVSSSALTLVVNLLIGLSFFCCIITVTKPQSTTQDSIGGGLAQTFPWNESLHILWRKRKVLRHHLSWRRSRRQLRACLFIWLKTDTFGHAVLQQSVAVCLLKMWHSVSPQLEGAVTKERLRAIFKIWH